MLLERFTPLGSSACPLFARKFGTPALGSVQAAAAEYLSTGRRRLHLEEGREGTDL